MWRILLVDDDKDFSAALARMLAQEGYRTCVAGGAACALKHFTEHETIDLVIADLQLCQESGLNLCSQLRQQQPGLPVILLSASPDAASYLEALRCGAYEYLAKPLDFAELRGVLQRALSPVGRNP
jgi:DNA-binding NtrC family response regulator